MDSSDSSDSPGLITILWWLENDMMLKDSQL